jgi:hypothetical protein
MTKKDMVLLKQKAMGISLYTIQAFEETGGFRSLQEGDKVDFEIEQTQRGPQAVKVEKQGS